MKDPGYYRDLINEILSEQPEDDFPSLPSRADIETRKRRHLAKMGRFPAWIKYVSPYKKRDRLGQKSYEIRVPLNLHWPQHCWWIREAVGFYDYAYGSGVLRRFKIEAKRTHVCKDAALADTPLFRLVYRDEKNIPDKLNMAFGQAFGISVGDMAIGLAWPVDIYASSQELEQYLEGWFSQPELLEYIDNKGSVKK